MVAPRLFGRAARGVYRQPRAARFIFSNCCERRAQRRRAFKDKCRAAGRRRDVTRLGDVKAQPIKRVRRIHF